jgi:hypothetical protein
MLAAYVLVLGPWAVVLLVWRELRVRWFARSRR